MKDALTSSCPALTERARLESGWDGVVVHERTSFRIPTNSLKGPGTLHLGCQWDAHFPLESQFVITPRGSCEVQGEFNIFSGCFASINGSLELGSGYINNGARIYVFRRLVVGHNVFIGENVTIRDSDNHKLEDRAEADGEIHIGDNVWIGMNATVLKGVRIGAGAVVAACALVNRDVPAATLVAGVPARPVRKVKVI